MKLNFKKLPKGSKTPILTYCRKLLADGVNPDETLEIYRNGPDADVIVKSIGDAAKLTVQEDWHVSPRFVKFRNRYPSSPTQTQKGDAI